MLKNKFKWLPGDPPPPIEAHSIAKLNVLHGYLVRYVETLSAQVHVPKLRFDIVDGFAGGGLFTKSDGTLQLGSPLTFLEAIESARVSAGEKRGRPLEIDANYYFVDRDKLAIQFLLDTLRERGYADRIGRDIQVICGTWVDTYPRIISEIAGRRRKGRSIFLLDQCGYTDAPLGSIADVMTSLPSAEVILNFAVDFLANYQSTREEFRKAMRSADLDERIVDDPVIAMKNKGWRFALERELSREIRFKTGSKFSTPFYVVSEESQNAYWLVHLCLHPKAHDEMLKTHWSVGNHFRHYGGAGLDMHMWGYSARNDPGLDGILDLGFNEAGREQCISSLLDEIPRRIHEYPEGITLGALKDMICNNVVVPNDLLAEQLVHLQRAEKEISLITPSGNERSSALGLKDDDLIRVNRQIEFSFFKA